MNRQHTFVEQSFGKATFGIIVPTGLQLHANCVELRKHKAVMIT